MKFEESLQPISAKTEGRGLRSSSLEKLLQTISFAIEGRGLRSRAPERSLQTISSATILSWEEAKDLLGILPDAAILTLFTDGSELSENVTKFLL